MARSSFTLETAVSRSCRSRVCFSEVVDFVELPVQKLHEEECFLQIVPPVGALGASSSDEDVEDSSFAGLKTFYAIVDRVERRRTFLPTRTEDVGHTFLCAPKKSSILQRRRSKMQIEFGVH